MSKARDLANAGTALTTVSATELGYLDGVTSAVQTQINSKEATLPSQTGNTGKYLTTDGSAKSWGTVSQYALPSQTGNSGKFLTTNGTAESWGTVPAPSTTYTLLSTNTMSGNAFNISGIDQGYRDLYITSSLITASGTDARLKIDSDTSYTFWQTGIRGGIDGNRVGNNAFISNPYRYFKFDCYISNYASTTIKKFGYFNVNAGTTTAAQSEGGTGTIFYDTTTAFSNIRFTESYSSGTWSGTVLVYGIK
jgi:hypothetical protein